MNLWVTVGMAAAGAVSGPALRAAIFRYSVPAGQPWRDTCPHCNAPAARRTLAKARALPASGRCPSCRTPVGPPGGAVEIITAGVLALLAWRIADPLVLLGFSWAALAGVALSFIDIRVHRLPNRLVLTALGGLVSALTLAAVLHQDLPRLGTALGCAAATMAVYLLLALIPHGYGVGDIKTASVTSVAAGWFGVETATAALVAGLVLTGLAGAVLLTLGRARDIAHGPCMFSGALIAVLVGS